MLTVSEKREKGRQQQMDKKGKNREKTKTTNKMVKARNGTSVTVQVNIST
jgi:hypothetical protein